VLVRSSGGRHASGRRIKGGNRGGGRYSRSGPCFGCGPFGVVRLAACACVPDFTGRSGDWCRSGDPASRFIPRSSAVARPIPRGIAARRPRAATETGRRCAKRCRGRRGTLKRFGTPAGHPEVTHLIFLNLLALDVAPVGHPPRRRHRFVHHRGHHRCHYSPGHSAAR